MEIIERPNNLPSWVKPHVRPYVREAYRDNDGFWMHMFDEYECEESSTLSGDTAQDAHDCFWHNQNAALRAAILQRVLVDCARLQAEAEAKLAAAKLTGKRVTFWENRLALRKSQVADYTARLADVK